MVGKYVSPLSKLKEFEARKKQTEEERSGTTTDIINQLRSVVDPYYSRSETERVNEENNLNKDIDTYSDPRNFKSAAKEYFLSEETPKTEEDTEYFKRSLENDEEAKELFKRLKNRMNK